MLPTYTNDQQNAGCTPYFEVTTLQTSGSVTAYSALRAIKTVSGENRIRPTDSSLHISYTFYIKVKSKGTASHVFGPYEVRVGCTTDTVSYSTNAAFDTVKDLYVGDSLTNAYTFTDAVATRSYCTALKNEIYTTAGVIWPSASLKLYQCTSNPCTQYDIVSTTLPDEFDFKVFSTFYGSMTLLSPAAKIRVTCSAAYTISATSVVDQF